MYSEGRSFKRRARETRSRGCSPTAPCSQSRYLDIVQKCQNGPSNTFFIKLLRPTRVEEQEENKSETNARAKTAFRSLGRRRRNRRRGRREHRKPFERI